MLDSFIKQISDELDMKDSITSPAADRYVLSFQNDVDVEVTNAPHGYAFTGTIAKVPERNAEILLTQLMEGNLFGQGTYGGILGINEDETLITFSNELDQSSSYKDFKNKIEDCVNVISFWKNEALKYQ